MTATVWNFLGQVARDEFVRTVEALAIAQALVDNAFHGRAVVPAESGGLLAPDVAFVGLHLAETPFGAGVPQNVHLVFGRHAVPVEAVVFGVTLRLVENLLAPLAERLADGLGDREHDHRLLIRVVADADAEAAQLVGQLRLEVGAELFHAGVGQGPGIE